MPPRHLPPRWIPAAARAGLSPPRPRFPAQPLTSQLQLDLDRIPLRNLSRDDRILSAHARDARYPFLDLAFVRYVSDLPVWAKCNPLVGGAPLSGRAPLPGDKLLVRLAADACGLPRAARRVKRAMQFGTRSAKLNPAPSRGHRVGEAIVLGAGAPGS